MRFPKRAGRWSVRFVHFPDANLSQSCAKSWNRSARRLEPNPELQRITCWKCLTPPTDSHGVLGRSSCQSVAMSVRITHFAARFVGTAIVLAVALLLSGRASASCGDYVTVVKDGTPFDQQHMPVHPKLPCHGPTCSSLPSLPDLPLTTQLPPTGEREQWGHCQPDRHVDLALSKVSYAPTPVDSAIKSPRTIFRPPRGF